MPWIRTDRGLFNADYVQSIHVRYDKTTKNYTSDVIGPDGRLAGLIIRNHRPDWEAELSPIVPAAAGSVAYTISVMPEKDQRPTAEDVFVNMQTIIAWRINGDTPDPIVPDPIGSNETMLILNADSTVIEQYVRTHESLEAAKAIFLEDAQRVWDAENTSESRKAGTQFPE